MDQTVITEPFTEVAVNTGIETAVGEPDAAELPYTFSRGDMIEKAIIFR